MKQINPLVAVCCIAAFLLAITSCSKDSGSTGPAGATGPAGPAGPAGPTGTANVIYSAWLNASYTAALDTINAGLVDTVYYYDANVPKLTNAILNGGEIKYYLNLGDSANATVVPIPYLNPLSDINEKITPYFFVGGIEFDSNVDPSTYTGNDGTKYNQWRYILIPGGSSARSAINWNNYAEVKKYLKLKD